jgi:uncharacterized protein YuzE
MGKSKIKVWCDDETDILYISLKEGQTVDSEETAEGVRIEYGVTGETLGIEVTGASRFLAKTLIRKIEEGISKCNTGFVTEKRGKYKRDIT